MPHGCGCHYPHHCCYPWAVDEESLPPRLRPSAGPSREDDIRRLEDERDRQKRGCSGWSKSLKNCVGSAMPGKAEAQPLGGRVGTTGPHRYGSRAGA